MSPNSDEFADIRRLTEDILGSPNIILPRKDLIGPVLRSGIEVDLLVKLFGDKLEYLENTLRETLIVKSGEGEGKGVGRRRGSWMKVNEFSNQVEQVKLMFSESVKSERRYVWTKVSRDFIGDLNFGILCLEKEIGKGLCKEIQEFDFQRGISFKERFAGSVRDLDSKNRFAIDLLNEEQVKNIQEFAQEPKRLDNELSVMNRNFQEEIKTIKLRHAEDLREVREMIPKANEVAKSELIGWLEKSQNVLLGEIETIKRSALVRPTSNEQATSNVKTTHKVTKSVNFTERDSTKDIPNEIID